MRKVIGIDHQFHFISNRLTHSAHPRRIDAGIFGIDGNDHFESLLPLGNYLLGHLNQLFCAVLLEAERYVRLHWIMGAAKQAPDRLVVLFPFDVPKRNVDGAYCRAPHTGLSARIKSGVELLPNAFGFQWILVAQERGELAIDEFSKPKSLRAARKTVTGYALVGFDLGEKHRRSDFLGQQRHFYRNSMQSCLDFGDFQIVPRMR